MRCSHHLVEHPPPSARIASLSASTAGGWLSWRPGWRVCCRQRRSNARVIARRTGFENDDDDASSAAGRSSFRVGIEDPGHSHSLSFTTCSFTIYIDSDHAFVFLFFNMLILIDIYIIWTIILTLTVHTQMFQPLYSAAIFKYLKR